MDNHFLEAFAWAWKIFSGLVTFLFLALVGVNRKLLKKYLEEHDRVVVYVNDKTSQSAEELKKKKDEDWHEVITYLKTLKTQNEEIKHDVNQARQATSNLQILLKAKGLI